MGKQKRTWKAGGWAAVAVWALLASVALAKDDTASLFLDMRSVGLGRVSQTDETKQFLTTVQLEKLKVQRKMLSVVYDNAYQLYRKGDYEGAQELAGKVLSIDPGYDDAALLKTAAGQLKGTDRPRLGEHQMIEDRFKAGLQLYDDRRLVEAQRKFEEITKLNPGNLKARYWLKKIQKELAEEHFARGEEAYREHHVQDALDRWYSTMLLNPAYPGLADRISKAETELREAAANQKMEDSLKLYSQGRLQESLDSLNQVLQVTPGEPKAQRLMAEVKGEIASQHVANGDKLYNARKFTSAMDEWRKAQQYGYDPRLAEARVARAKEMMRREDDTAKRKTELAKKKKEDSVKEAEEAKKKQQEEAAAKKKAEEEAKAAGGESATPSAAPALPAAAPAAAAKTPDTGASAKPPDTAAAPAATPAAAPASPSGVMSATGNTQATPEQIARVNEENKRSAQQHYLNGVVYFQQKQYDKAKYEWTLAKQQDPSNPDVDAGLRRIDAMVGGQ